jgi:hypothetical protein
MPYAPQAACCLTLSIGGLIHAQFDVELAVRIPYEFVAKTSGSQRPWGIFQIHIERIFNGNTLIDAYAEQEPSARR